MTLDGKPLEAIEEQDLQALVDDEVPESRTIDYKKDLPGNSDSDKKEFLADVCSFANATGGHLVFGVREEYGVPVEVNGLHGIDTDKEILRLENTIRNGIKPRIPGLATKDVTLAEGRAIVIRVPRSFAQPHVVDYKGHWRFYSRNSRSKYPIDLLEVRAAFALSETSAARIRDFRSERLSNVIAGETPIKLCEAPKVVLHILPLSAFDPSAKVNVGSASRDIALLSPLSASHTGSGLSERHNFDGFLRYFQVKADCASSYVQVFRTGILEYADAFILEGDPAIASIAYEKEILATLGRSLSLEQELGIQPPFFVMLSLLGVSGYTMNVGRRWPVGRGMYNQPIERNDLVIPEVVIDNYDADLPAVMRTIFDAVWNAAGWPRSMNYSEEGEWRETP